MKDLWTPLEKRQTVVPELDEVLEISVAGSYELETAANVVGDLIVVHDPGEEIVTCVNSLYWVRHDEPGYKDLSSRVGDLTNRVFLLLQELCTVAAISAGHGATMTNTLIQHNIPRSKQAKRKHNQDVALS